MFTVLSDNCLKPGSPEAKEGREAERRERCCCCCCCSKESNRGSLKGFEASPPEYCAPLRPPWRPEPSSFVCSLRGGPDHPLPSNLHLPTSYSPEEALPPRTNLSDHFGWQFRVEQGDLGVAVPGPLQRALPQTCGTLSKPNKEAVGFRQNPLIRLRLSTFVEKCLAEHHTALHSPIQMPSFLPAPVTEL